MKKGKIELNGIKRTTCSLEDKNPHLFGLGLGLTVGRRISHLVAFSSFALEFYLIK